MSISYKTAEGNQGVWILWKGIQIEHFNRLEQLDETAIKRLTEACQHLENLGVPVSVGSVVWRSSWFQSAGPATPYLDYLRKMPEIWERGAEIGFEWGKPSKDGSHTFGRLLVWDGESWRIEPCDGAPGSSSYHTLVPQGWEIARVGQGDELGCCMGDLPGLLECFCRHQLPEEFPTSFFVSLLDDLRFEVEAEERHQ